MAESPRILKKLETQDTLEEILDFLNGLSRDMSAMDKRQDKLTVLMEQQSKDIALVNENVKGLKESTDKRMYILENIVNDPEKGLISKVAKHDAVIDTLKVEKIPEKVNAHGDSIKWIIRVLWVFGLSLVTFSLDNVWAFFK
jgi:SMC interacting uncharacterized protein involved in chromosome segregation